MEVVANLLPYTDVPRTHENLVKLVRTVETDLAGLRTFQRRSESPSHKRFRENLFLDQVIAQKARDAALQAARSESFRVCVDKAKQARKACLDDVRRWPGPARNGLVSELVVAPDRPARQPDYFCTLSWRSPHTGQTETRKVEVAQPKSCSRLTQAELSERYRLYDSMPALQRQADMGNPIPLLAAEARLTTLRLKAAAHARYKASR